MNVRLEFKKALESQNPQTFFISGLGIEVMSHDIFKGQLELTSILNGRDYDRWRLPTPDECFCFWSLKQLDTGNFHDWYYWCEDDPSVSLARIFKMDVPFVATRSRYDHYYIRLVRDI